MEIFPRVHQIRSTIADRHLFQYLFTGDNVLLLDTGMAPTPNDVILPYLRQAGVAPERLTLAVNTHADADHHGGNAALKQAAPQVVLACGEADRDVIEDPDRLFALRYNQWVAEHGVGLSLVPGAEDWVRGMVGQRRRIDLTLLGGESLAIDDRWAVRVLHLPGHSNGHLAFYDPRNKAVYIGDALHGLYCPSREGVPSLPPAYFSVLAYLGSIQMVQSLDLEWIYSAHWPPYGGPRLCEFLADCRRFVAMVDEALRQALEDRPGGLTLRASIEELGPRLGDFPENNRWLLMYPFFGHLTQLEEMGRARRITGEGATRWVAA